MEESYRKRWSVVVLAGGPSAERAISLESGQAVAEALRERGHRVRLLDPARESLEKFAWETVDAAFIALHGEYGEDGQVQRQLEKLGVAFTGAGAEASAVAFSKSAAKERFVRHGVPTPEYVLVERQQERSELKQKVAQLGLPLVVKPDRQGSSIGVSWVRDWEEFFPALDLCFRYGCRGVVERAIEGEEWTVALLDELVFPPLKIVPAVGYFDYKAKYEDQRTRYLFAAPGEEELAEQLVRTAQKACQAVGVTGLARVDFRVDAEERRPWVLEINTVPGMTSHSLVPKAAARVGLSLGELCEQMLERCLRRRRHKGGTGQTHG